MEVRITKNKYFVMAFYRHTNFGNNMRYDGMRARSFGSRIRWNRVEEDEPAFMICFEAWGPHFVFSMGLDDGRILPF